MLSIFFVVRFMTSSRIIHDQSEIIELGNVFSFKVISCPVDGFKAVQEYPHVHELVTGTIENASEDRKLVEFLGFPLESIIEIEDSMVLSDEFRLHWV